MVPFKVDLSDKVVALTGAGGVLISEFAKALAECGAKVALLDINLAAAQKVADEIGENAVAIETNALSTESLENAKRIVNEKFGKVNFLVNGAGGNNPKATTDNETMTPDISDDVKTFFKIDEAGLRPPGDDPGQGRLADARRAPEDHGGNAVAFDEPAQHLSFPQQVLLSDIFIQGPGSEPGGQGFRDAPVKKSRLFHLPDFRSVSSLTSGPRIIIPREERANVESLLQKSFQKIKKLLNTP